MPKCMAELRKHPADVPLYQKCMAELRKGKKRIMKIFNLGSLNIDYVYSVAHFVQPGETLSSLNLETFSGGKGLNQSVALARAGASVVHGGLIGEDGLFLKKMLSDSGADVSFVKTIEERTGHAIIQVEPNGQNNIILFSGANHKFTEAYLDEFLADAKPGDILLLQNETNCLNEAFEKAHGKNMQIAFNPSPFDKKLLNLPLSYVNWWFCNEIEGKELFGKELPEEIMKAFSEQYPDSNLILTLGKQGSVFKNKDQKIYQPIYEVKAVDTTAAGDTFTGYFLAKIAEGKSIAEALNTASLASSLAVSRKGAAPSIPYANELEMHM